MDPKNNQRKKRTMNNVINKLCRAGLQIGIRSNTVQEKVLERLAGDRTGRLVTEIPWEFTVFISDRHSTFLGNPTFQNNLLHILVDRPAYDGS